MAARSIGSLTLSFGLVAIPVKLYGTGESSSGIRARMASCRLSRTRRQVWCERRQRVVSTPTAGEGRLRRRRAAVRRVGGYGVYERSYPFTRDDSFRWHLANTTVTGTGAEVEAFLARGEALLAAGIFPAPSGEWPSIPGPAYLGRHGCSRPSDQWRWLGFAPCVPGRRRS